jgi:5-methylcytosine-specific restriction endonuclease McrA
VLFDAKKYRQDNLEKVRARDRKWHAKNRKRLAERRRARYWKDPEKARAERRQGYYTHRDEILVERRQNAKHYSALAMGWAHDNPEAVKRSSIRFRAAHKDELAFYDAWYQVVNTEALRAARRERRRRNPEKYREQERAARGKSPEKYKGYGQADYARHREERRASGQKYYAAHREAGIQQSRGWRLAHPQEFRALALRASHKRRAAVCAGGTYAPEDWKILCDFWGNECLACGSTEDLECDHVVPIVLGGHNQLGNLQLLCSKCNGPGGKWRRVIDYRPELPARLRKQLFGEK